MTHKIFIFSYLKKDFCRIENWKNQLNSQQNAKINFESTILADVQETQAKLKHASKLYDHN